MDELDKKREAETAHDRQREIHKEVRREERVRAYDERHPRGRSWGTILFFLLVMFAVGIAATFMFLRSAVGGGSAARIASALLGRNVSFDSSAPAVVNRIQQLNKLETVAFSVDAVVEGNKTSPMLPDLLFGDRLLLVAHGQTVAGVDLGKLQADAVHVNGKSVTVDLPASEVFYTRLDNAKTRVYMRNTGMLAQQDTNLEGDTRKSAEDQILKAAIADGILDTARANARASITSLLTGLGFESVTVR